MSFALDDYDYALPEGLIAQFPQEPRDRCRLMVLDCSARRWEHRRFGDLRDVLRPTDILVANNSKVIRARLLGRRILGDRTGTPAGPGDGSLRRGGSVEFLMLKEISPLVWEGLFHASARPVVGFRFEAGGVIGEVIRSREESSEGLIVARFDRDPLEAQAGQLPLPKYIQAWQKERPQEESFYQTVYAKNPGSSAAPTAGLHFTEALVQSLLAQGVGWKELTLHVGLGTFRPVKAPDVRNHSMHEETYTLEESVAQDLTRAKREGKRLIAVGTTSVRALEDAWDPEEKMFRPGTRSTQRFIYPGSGWNFVIDGLITNFHLPRSTLLMLISAFAGREFVLSAYREAIAQQYRFFSYGDAMFLSSNPGKT